VLVRLLLLLEAVAALALLVWLLQPRQRSALSGVLEAGGLRALELAGRLGAVLLAVSLLANVVGNVSLAEVLLEGTLLAAFVAMLLRGSVRVLRGLWSVLLHVRPLTLLAGVRRHEALLRRRGATLVGRGLALLWLWFVLGFFRLREPVWNGLVAAFGATWPVGELELSLGDLVAFGVTLWLAFWLSRFVRFVLDEDVLPRAELPRGVPYAISSVTHYAILLFGFLLAVSAAGFDMSRFALIVGALGVGIGIGLQDVVNNFVSGAILLFERPVQTGDTVQVGELFGEVRRIGMRSSTVRTWSGAEVIVPNSKLVSENVVNWTLSDDLRRIEIPIGVAYGTDPERVLALLTEVARSHPSVLAEPEPNAVFLAHGDSSLDFELRAWTGSADWYTVRSDLTVAMNRALREAGISIPFPQRDLHLRSVDPEVRETLRRE
jgi:small-conductance mechanosensitive channel